MLTMFTIYTNACMHALTAVKGLEQLLVTWSKTIPLWNSKVHHHVPWASSIQFTFSVFKHPFDYYPPSHV